MRVALKQWVASSVCVVMLLCIWNAALAVEPGGSSQEPKLVFTSFPSDGMGLLFSRILTEAYGRIGYQVEVMGVPARRALSMSNEGMCDGEGGRVAVIEDEYPNLVRVPVSLYTNRIVAYAVRDDIPSEGGWDSLFGYTVGVVAGYKYIEEHTKDMQRVIVRDYCKLFALLENGRIDVAVVEELDASPTLISRPVPGLRSLGPALATNPMYHYLNKKNAHLVPQVEAVLRRMRDEGRLDAIRSELEAEFGRTPVRCDE